MLKALKSQLVELANSSDASMEKRFYKETNYAEAKKHLPELQNFVLCLPDLLQQIRIWFESDLIPSNLKKVHGYLLTYVYHSLDFLPVEDFGFWGYLDDAYFAGLVYQKTVQHQPNNENRFSQDFTNQVNTWLEKTHQVIPQHATKLDELLEALLQGETQSFHSAIVS